MSDVIKRMIEHVTEECSIVDLEKRYDEMIDDCYSFKEVGGPFAHMQPSQVLREMDATAYHCGMNDWEDSEDLIEIDGNYYNRDEVEEARDVFVGDLESELSDFERKLDELKNSDNHEDTDDLQLVKDSISDIEAAIKECKEYTF